MGRLTEKDSCACLSCAELDWCRYECKTSEIYEKLRHYEDLEEQGRLIEQKHGRWIYKHDEEGNTGNAQYECSECGAGDLHAKSQEVPYCWKCGAKMSSEPSDEEKQAMTEEAFDILAKMDEVE